MCNLCIINYPHTPKVWCPAHRNELAIQHASMKDQTKKNPETGEVTKITTSTNLVQDFTEAAKEVNKYFRYLTVNLDLVFTF